MPFVNDGSGALLGGNEERIAGGDENPSKSMVVASMRDRRDGKLDASGHGHVFRVGTLVCVTLTCRAFTCQKSILVHPTP